MTELEPRLQKLENGHNLLLAQSDYRDKSLERIETSIEKINETLAKFLVIDERVHSNTEKNKENQDRITKLEESQRNSVWSILVLFIGGFVTFVYNIGK